MKAAICTSIDDAIPLAQVIPMIRAAGFEVVSIGANPTHADFTTPAGRYAGAATSARIRSTGSSQPDWRITGPGCRARRIAWIYYHDRYR